MKPREFIRIWTEGDIQGIAAHLLIVGESTSNCSHCRELGLDFTQIRACPQCKMEFKFITSRHAGGGSPARFHWIRKIKEKRPDLVFIDYEDFEKNWARFRARDLLK